MLGIKVRLRCLSCVLSGQRASNVIIYLGLSVSTMHLIVGNGGQNVVETNKGVVLRLCNLYKALTNENINI